MEEQQQITETSTETADADKRQYVKPVLQEFGNVRELTRGTGTKNVDFGGGEKI
ncbi:lasso RiPP family leader peptide-containing protein [Endomicrobium sp. AH-315-J14]|nr:lasso RiPP family leader peptide-containing protein [Endomicrobium sp. AH-315-J14]